MGIKLRGMAIILAISTLVLFGCDSTGAGGSDVTGATSGTISINSVSPSSGLSAGVSTSFEVIIQYTAEGGQAEIMIGFNSGSSPNYYTIEEEIIVQEGSGSHTFNVTTTPKDWSSESDTFKVKVYLSEEPHPDSWSPLDTETQVLTLAS